MLPALPARSKMPNWRTTKSTMCCTTARATPVTVQPRALSKSPAAACLPQKVTSTTRSLTPTYPVTPNWARAIRSRLGLQILLTAPRIWWARFSWVVRLSRLLLRNSICSTGLRQILLLTAKRLFTELTARLLQTVWLCLTALSTQTATFQRKAR